MKKVFRTMVMATMIVAAAIVPMAAASAQTDDDAVDQIVDEIVDEVERIQEVNDVEAALNRVLCSLGVTVYCG